MVGRCRRNIIERSGVRERDYGLLDDNGACGWRGKRLEGSAGGEAGGTVRRYFDRDIGLHSAALSRRRRLFRIERIRSPGAERCVGFSRKIGGFLPYRS